MKDGNIGKENQIVCKWRYGEIANCGNGDTAIFERLYSWRNLVKGSFST